VWTLFLLLQQTFVVLHFKIVCCINTKFEFETNYTECPRYKYTKINACIFVPKRFMKFIFSALYRVIQNVFNACQYTSMWAPVFKLLPRVYQHVTCYKLDCFNDTLSQISQISNFSSVYKHFIFQQDGAPPHFHRNVTTFLYETFLDVGSEEEVLLPGPLDLRI
jgi:hypothetical protein